MKGYIFIPIFFLLVLASSAYTETIYKWVDKEGVVNFTDDYSKVPPLYRNRVEVEERKEVEKREPPIQPQEPLQKGEGKTTTDTLGRGETYWSERARPWKAKLKEATENYESTNKKIIEKAETISRRNWGATQYKMNIMELDKLKEERSKYEAQMNEANEMLKKLSKEAELFKANPDWVK